MNEANRSVDYRAINMAVLLLAIFSSPYAQYQLSALAYKIIPDLGLTTSQFSSVFSAPMVPAIFLSILAGAMADRFGVKRVISVGLIIAAAGTFLRLAADSYFSLFFFMMMSGFGVAFLNANAAKIIGSMYSPEKVGKFMGIVIVSATIGMTLGTATTAYFPSVKSAYYVAGILAVLSMACWMVFMRDGQPDDTGALPQQPILICLGVVAKEPAIWLAGVCLMLILGATLVLAAFLPNALKLVAGMSPAKAGQVAAMLIAGNVLGSILGPVICQRLGRMKPFMLTMGLMSALGAVFAWMAPGVLLTGGGLLVTGLAMGSMIPLFMTFPILLPRIGPLYAGSAGGLIATIQLIGAVVIPTYIIAPIAGDNFLMLFALAGVCMLCMTGVVFLLPELGHSMKQMNDTLAGLAPESEAAG